MRSKFVIFIIFVFSSLTLGQTKITDIIKPINLIAGVKDSAVISDLFYAENYELKFQPNKNVKISFEKASGKITFDPDLNFSGITLVDFSLNAELYSIPVRSRKQQKYKFSYKPNRKYENLFLFGSFNGWDRGNLPMKDDNGDGIFEAEVALEPGRYEYKFFGDGVEIADPNNPDKKPNGFGDFNSLYNVKEPAEGKHFLHVDSFTQSKSASTFSFIYENEKHGSSIPQKGLFALWGNQRISNKHIKILGNKVLIKLPNYLLKGKNLLRVVVSKNGRSSNIQSVNIFDGKPADNSNFTWNDAIIYSLMIDRFNDGDKTINKPVQHDSLSPKANYMGGDFQGIINKINEGYFSNLGINTLWISPVNDNPDRAYKEAPEPHRWFSGYHGYWPISSNMVEDQFGDISKLRELVSVAHKNGIKILLDFVANHVHELHPIVKEKQEWFGNMYLPDGRKNLRLWDEQRLTTWFEPYLPKFNFVGSKEVIDYMVNNAIWWLRTTDADGFRQDAVKHISNDFWRALTRQIKKEVEVPEQRHIYQIGETFGSYDLINSYVNNGQLSAQFNFNLYDTALPAFLDPKISFKALDAEIKKSFLVYGENNLMGNVMDSHDKNRFMSFADGDLELSQWSATEEGWNNPPKVDNPKNYNKAILYYAYMNAIPGLPVIYYGSEFGMTGASDPDNRRMMRFSNELSEDEYKTLADVSKIINIRKEHSALRHGDFLTLQADEKIYAFMRSDMNERILVVLNKSNDSVTSELTIPSFVKAKKMVSLISGEEFSIQKNKAIIKTSGVSYNYFIIKTK